MFKRTQPPVPRYDRELFDAFDCGRLVPKNQDQQDWFDAVKSGRITLEGL